MIRQLPMDGGPTRRYRRFCAAAGANTVPGDDEVVNAFLCSLRGMSLLSIVRHRRSIEHAHDLAGYPPPTISTEARLVERAARKVRHVLDAASVMAMLTSLDPSVPADARDGAICVLRLIHGCDNESMRSMRVEEVRLSHEGVRIGGRHVPQREDVACLSRWLGAWLGHLGRDSGPLFVGWSMKGEWMREAMNPGTFTRVLRSAARRAGVARPDGAHRLFAPNPAVDCRRRAE